MVKVLVVLILVNHISKDGMLGKAIDLFKTFISWLLKLMLAGIIGINALQGIILPSVDGIQTTFVRKTISMIPGIGSSAEAVAQIVSSSGILLKNAFGVAGCVIMVILVAAPMVQMVIFTLVYQILGAMLQPISDKRMIEAISGIGDGGKLLLQIVTIVLIVFILTIAIVCAVTGMGIK
jgi:stage III sporulation protein AE